METQMLRYHKKNLCFEKMLCLAFFQTHVPTCQLQLPLYDAPAHQNITNEMKKTKNFCKNNGLALTKLLHMNHFLKD